jgi:hypothetical protein
VNGAAIRPFKCSVLMFMFYLNNENIVLKKPGTGLFLVITANECLYEKQKSYLGFDVAYPGV